VAKHNFDKLVQGLIDAAVNEGMHGARGTYPMQGAYDRTHAARDALMVAINKATRGVDVPRAPEPVAWRWKYGDTDHHPWVVMDTPPLKGLVFRLEPLYTAGVALPEATQEKK